MTAKYAFENCLISCNIESRELSFKYLLCEIEARELSENCQKELSENCQNIVGPSAWLWIWKENNAEPMRKICLQDIHFYESTTFSTEFRMYFIVFMKIVTPQITRSPRISHTWHILPCPALPKQKTSTAWKKYKKYNCKINMERNF